MLTKWGLSNFKSIYNADIELAPLTVLTGINSSGKSSLLQSMLMIAQTIQNPNTERALMINGPLVELGSPESIVSQDNTRDDSPAVAINWTWESKTECQVKRILWKSTFNFNSSQPGLNTNRYQIDFNTDKAIEIESKIPIEGKDIPASQFKRTPDLTQNGFVNPKYNFGANRLSDMLLVKESSGSNIKKMDWIKFNHILPEASISQEQIIVNGLSYSNSGFYLSENKPEPSPLEDLATPNKIIIHFFKSMKYIGPLRFKEKLYKFLTGNDTKDTGIQGQFTAASLYENRASYIDYTPNREILQLDGLNSDPLVFNTVGHKDHININSAVDKWLNYLGFEGSIRVKPETEGLGYIMEFIPSSRSTLPVNVYHVGTGVSQVLPILITCLLAEPGSTLIFEQPELHLHPRVQSRLADFFLSMALLGKQCIIETHSEYLIYALRYRISESLLKHDETIQKAVKLLFFDKKNGKSEFQEIEVNKYGEISAWPDGFFDERKILSDKIMDSILSDMDGKND
jgi:AAA15 family ATPase/GTPase